MSYTSKGSVVHFYHWAFFRRMVIFLTRLVVMIFKERQDGGVRFWTFNRPERGNGLGTSMAAAMTAAMKKLQTELGNWGQGGYLPDSSPCRVLVLDATLGGKGQDIWIAGGDLVELTQLPTAASGQAYSDQLSAFLADLESLPIPVLASIDGAAIGGGAELALAADLRFGSERCCFEFKQLQIGLVTGYGSCHRLIAAAGLSVAKDLLLRGRKIIGQDLLRYGLLHELVTTREDLCVLVLETAQNLCRLNPVGLMKQKSMLSTAADLLNASHRSEEGKILASLWMNDFHKAALGKFVASRKGKS
jgi:enoyl-CoA hydratase/carnithine racemase